MSNKPPALFEGFDPPESNWFKMPNVMVGIMATMRSLAELKVILYILRHTWGYSEYGVPKKISIDEFEHGRKRKDGSRMDLGCGLARSNIIRGLQEAANDGFIVVTVDGADKARIKKYYQLRMRGAPTTPEEDGEEPDPAVQDSGVLDQAPGYPDLGPQGSRIRTPGVSHQDLGGPDAGSRSEKDTIRKTLQKDVVDDGAQQEILKRLAELGIDPVVAAEIVTKHGPAYVGTWCDYYETTNGVGPGYLVSRIRSGVPAPEVAQAEISALSPEVLPGMPAQSEAAALWDRILGDLQLQMTRATFETWLKGTQGVHLDDGRLAVQVRTGHAKEWLGGQLLTVIERTAARLHGGPLRVEFVVRQLSL